MLMKIIVYISAVVQLFLPISSHNNKFAVFGHIRAVPLWLSYHRKENISNLTLEFYLLLIIPVKSIKGVFHPYSVFH